MHAVRATADHFAQRLHDREQLPVYKYGDASPLQQSLKDVRRMLGYFTNDSEPLTAEKLQLRLRDQDHTLLQPDIGDMRQHFDPRKGVSCVGAVPLILNFNMRFRAEDPRSRVIQVTKHIRSGDVEALTLPHENGSYEVACNLRNPKHGTRPEAVLAAAQAKSKELGIEIIDSYLTGPTEEQLLAAIPL